MLYWLFYVKESNIKKKHFNYTYTGSEYTESLKQLEKLQNEKSNWLHTL